MEHVKTVKITDRKVQAALRRLRENDAARRALDEKISADKVIVKQAMGDAEEATVGGVKVATWKTTIRQSLSATLVKKKYPEVAEECQVMSEVRTFKLVDPE